jgi:hypothetical protein
MAGAPTKYKQDFDDQAYKLCLLGATDKEIADFFDVVESTVNLWKLEHPTFSESLKRGKTAADSNVGQRLYERAMGFEHDSEEIKVVSMGKEGSAIERVPIRKIYPPDTIAAIFWLKNRRPDKWRDKQEIAHDHKITKGFLNIDPLADDKADESPAEDSSVKEA